MPACAPLSPVTRTSCGSTGPTASSCSEPCSPGHRAGALPSGTFSGVPWSSVMTSHPRRAAMQDPNQRYARTYSESGLRRKLARYARAAGEEVAEEVPCLLYAAPGRAKPRRAEAAIHGALGYFIFPLDAIPDLAPLVGYTDDLGVLAAALTTVAFYINDDIKARTRVQMEKWFGPRTTDTGSEAEQVRVP